MIGGELQDAFQDGLGPTRRCTISARYLTCGKPAQRRFARHYRGGKEFGHHLPRLGWRSDLAVAPTAPAAEVPLAVHRAYTFVASPDVLHAFDAHLRDRRS